MENIDDLMKDYRTGQEELVGKRKAIASLEEALVEHRKIFERDNLDLERNQVKLKEALASQVNAYLDKCFTSGDFERVYKLVQDLNGENPGNGNSLETEVLTPESLNPLPEKQINYPLDGNTPEEKKEPSGFEFDFPDDKPLEPVAIEEPKYTREFIKDEKLLREICKYGESILDNPDAILKDIEYSPEKQVVTGSTPMFAVLTNMYLEKIDDKRRIATSWELNSREKGYCVEEGFLFTGLSAENSPREEPFLDYFNERNIRVNEDIDIYLPQIKIELSGLYLDENGVIIPGRDEVFWNFTENLFGKADFNFSERDKDGVPIKNPKGDKMCYVAKKPGLFRCVTDDSLNYLANMNTFDYSQPTGRIVLAKIVK